jgi:DNA helicase IV
LVRVLNIRKRQHNLIDIIATIQENQNRIVDTEFSTNIVVQGCAGSGKTMVLLHLISSLQYRMQHFDFSREALILTPNERFNLHIQGLAEGLQISNVQRLSVEEYYIDRLTSYSESLKPSTRLVSEMLVQQNFVDYVYSDQFRKDFDNRI